MSKTESNVRIEKRRLNSYIKKWERYKNQTQGLTEFIQEIENTFAEYGIVGSTAAFLLDTHFLSDTQYGYSRVNNPNDLDLAIVATEHQVLVAAELVEKIAQRLSGISNIKRNKFGGIKLQLHELSIDLCFVPALGRSYEDYANMDAMDKIGFWQRVSKGWNSNLYESLLVPNLGLYYGASYISELIWYESDLRVDTLLHTYIRCAKYNIPIRTIDTMQPFLLKMNRKDFYQAQLESSKGIRYSWSEYEQWEKEQLRRITNEIVWDPSKDSES